MLVLAWASALAKPVASGEPPSSATNEKLARRVTAVLETPGYRTGHWGILVVDGKTGQTVYERNADELFAPASVTKIFSAAHERRPEPVVGAKLNQGRRRAEDLGHRRGRE
jgi:D-alanyl-D-alanine carboxypeptidase/D-alanyl-D-alanine-endopeptidase (penicillin-binding protein 4)